MSTPLAERLRPTALDQFAGQESILGKKGLVSTLLEKAKSSSFFPSLIFWGPPGCGKTTLARLIAKELKREYYEFSAVNTSVKEIEKVFPAAHSQGSFLEDHPPIVFIDEIHRFNKAQQDALLPHVEKGTIVLLGATTENPSFSIIRALLSRCRVISLHALSENHLQSILTKALTSLYREMSTDDQKYLVIHSHGDARSLLNTLEIAGHLSQQKNIIKEYITQAFGNTVLGFDKHGEEFYNTISAFHKSMRSSDPDAALYWLARMLEAGQDPLYVARRLIRFASEDVGRANYQALPIATAAYQACQFLGMPECNLALAEATHFLATSPKSRQIYQAYTAASQDAIEKGNLSVPLHLRNTPTSSMKEGATNFPDELVDRSYFS